MDMHVSKEIWLRPIVYLCVMIMLITSCVVNSPAISQPTQKPSPLVTETTAPTTISTQAPTATSTISPCFLDGGVLERVMMDSVMLETELYALIYIPPCYDQSNEYPVLYLLHGQGMTDQFWFDMGVTRLADEAFRNGQQPFLIVMPYEERSNDPFPDSNFGDAVLTDLIPWVDGHYATCTERACRAVGGVSRGGGWALMLAMRNFDVFGTLGGHSITLMSADTWWIIHQLDTHSTTDFPRIYLDRGDRDYLSDGIDFLNNELDANNIPHEFHIYPGMHEIAYWQTHIDEYMHFYMSAWQ